MSAGGARGGPIEQGDLASRADVLAYTSEPLAAPMEITGPVRAEIWASTSAPDTDFTAKLVDVHPDGRSYNICDGIVRARTVVDIPLTPGRSTASRSTSPPRRSLFRPATGSRSQVSSSSWPDVGAKPQHRQPCGYRYARRAATAEQRVFHDPAHPSQIVLPFVPR